MASGFTSALLAGRLPIIMEVKRSDGEGAELMGERTIAEIVGQYVAAGAPCISVVTGRWFGGDDDMLREVAALTDRPLLKKDFITREKQIVAAKEMGASAILLTAKILPAKTFQHLIELALGHELTPFVEVVDQAELDTVIHPEELHHRGQQQGHQHPRARAGRHRHQSLAAGGDDAAGTQCPVSASAILDPRIAAELVDSGLQGSVDRHRAAARREHPRLGAGVRAPPRRAAFSRHARSISMSQTAVRSLADHFAEQVQRQPDAPALIWDGQPISYRELQQLSDSSYAELQDAGLPADRPVGLRAKKSPEAIGLILACLRARQILPAAVDRARARDAGPAVRPGRREPGALAPRAAQRERGQSPRAGRRDPRRARGAGLGVAAGRRRRGRHVHADHVGVHRPAEDRAANRERRRRVHRLGGRAVRDQAGHGGGQLRPAQLRPVPARHLDDAQARRLRGDGRPGPGHPGCVPGRPGRTTTR